MATDFFERQDVARRNTTRLVVLFALAVLAIIVSIDVLLAATMGYLARDPLTGAVDWTLAGDPQLVSLAVVGTLMVVGGGSLFKVAQLRGGGHVVAEQLGGRRLNPDTAVPSEQQLLNVVEEMAIASGTPVPQVYLLEQENGINAFAAGFSPSDAVIGVTRGAAEELTREELQGVIAHEFSHILNGDMRLSIRLMSMVAGLMAVSLAGRMLLRLSAGSGRGRDRGVVPLFMVGVGIAIIGQIGFWAGRILQAWISRKRECLADASAVQFTRNPEGLRDALLRIAAHHAPHRFTNARMNEGGVGGERAARALRDTGADHADADERADDAEHLGDRDADLAAAVGSGRCGCGGALRGGHLAIQQDVG
jgi:Zn-dependent protease with chaperone function